MMQFSTSVLERRPSDGCRRPSDVPYHDNASNVIDDESAKPVKQGDTQWINDKENHAPLVQASPAPKKGSALWLKLRETQAELEQSKAALRPLHEANERLEVQERQIADLKRQNEQFKLSEKEARKIADDRISEILALKEGKTDAAAWLKFHRAEIDEEANKALQDKEAEVQRLRAAIAQQQREPPKATDADDVRRFMRELQRRMVDTMGQMNEEVAKMHEQTDRNTRRMKRLAEARGKARPEQENASTLAASLVHKCVVRKLLLDIENLQQTEHDAEACQNGAAEAEEAEALRRERASLKADRRRLDEERESFQSTLKAEQRRLDEERESVHVERQGLQELKEVLESCSPVQDGTSSQQESKQALVEERETWRKEILAWSHENRELAHTVQMLVEEKQQLEAENKHISDVAAIFEKKYEDLAGQNARMMGHINHKQKIQHTLKLKEENEELRASLKIARQRCFQLEAGISSKRLDHLLASFGSLASQSSQSDDAVLGVAGRSMATRCIDANGAEVERMKIQLRHMISLIEGVVMDSPGEESTSDVTSLFDRLRDAIRQRTQRTRAQKLDGGSRSRTRSLPRMASA